MLSHHVPHQRASWDNTFLQIANEIAKRSPDAQTQVGAVIVSDQRHILGVGYNGWMPGIDDSIMPNIRPYKYRFVLHAEENAIYNCEHRPRGATLYCTHKPCLHCFCAIVTTGISELVYPEGRLVHGNPENAEWEVAEFLAKHLITIREVDNEI